MIASNHATSVGHVGFVFVGDSLYEYWVRGDSVYRASVHAPVMPDGYRSGRWFGYANLLTLEAIRCAS